MGPGRSVLSSFAPPLAAMMVACASPGVSAQVSEPTVRWRELGSPARTDHVMVWDSRRGRALMFGGDGEFATRFHGAWQTLSTPRRHWEPLVLRDEGPFPRSGCAAVYDSLLDRVLVFGGSRTDGDFGSSELWELKLSEEPQWSLLEPEGSTPPRRLGASVILDAADRLVLFGGFGAARTDSDVWILPLRDSPLHWRKVAQPGSGPGPRARHGAAYSPLTNRMLVFGGERILPNEVDVPDDVLSPAETWELALDEPVHWLRRSFESADTVPLPEAGGPMLTDASGQFAWLVSGWQGYFVNDPTTWRYDFTASAWMRVASAANGPESRVCAAACLERPSGYLFLHGGGFSLSSGIPYGASPQTWSLAPDEAPLWKPALLDPTLGTPTSSYPRADFDPVERALITWTREGVWTCDAPGDGAWSLEPVGAGGAPAMQDAMSVFDVAHRRLLVFGGVDDHRLELPSDRLWIWPLDGPGGWSSVPIAGSPPHGAWGTQCAYDARRLRVLVLPSSGWGFSSHGFGLDTLDVLDLAAPNPRWTRLATEGQAPGARSDGTTMIDTAHDRLVLLGGFVRAGVDGSLTRDLWTLALSPEPRWTRRIARSFSRDITTHVGLAIDPTLDRFVIIGGEGLGFFDFGPSNLLTMASLEDPVNLTTLDPDEASPMRGPGRAFFDAAADRVLWWDGVTLWEVTWPLGAPSAYGAARVAADTGGVHVTWPGTTTGPYVAVIERSVDGGRSWSRLTGAAPQADGSLGFTDREPPPAGSLVYRAVVERGGLLRVLGTASLALARTPPGSFALAPPRPNPSRDDVTIELASPVDADVTMELFDVSGRRVGAAIRRRLAAGSAAFTIPLARGLSPGVYLLRASDGDHTARMRIAVIH